MKKMKHRIVEHMSSSTADALGLSRAILCNGKFYDLRMKISRIQKLPFWEICAGTLQMFAHLTDHLI